MYTNFVTLDTFDWKCYICRTNIEILPGFIDNDLKRMSCRHCIDTSNPSGDDDTWRCCGYCGESCYKKAYSFDTISNKILIYHQSCHEKMKEIEDLIEDIYYLKDMIISHPSKHKLNRYKKMMLFMKSKLNSLLEMRNKKKDKIKNLNSNLLCCYNQITNINNILFKAEYDYGITLYQIEIAKAKKKMNLINADRCIAMAKKELDTQITNIDYLEKEMDMYQEKMDFLQNLFNIRHDDE